MKMTVYILDYCIYDISGGWEYVVIGVYTDVDKLEQDYIEYFKILKNKGESCYNIKDWINKDFNGGFEHGYVPHPMRVSKYLLNNDKTLLYEPGSEIYNTCLNKIDKLSSTDS